MEERETRGWSESDERICSSCVEDYALKAAVAAEEEDDQGNCSFCESTRSASFDALLDPFVDGIRFAYEDAVNVLSYVSSEGGFVGGSSIDTWDLLHWELSDVFDNSDISDHIYACLDDKTWVRSGEPRREIHVVLIDAWARFCHAIKHETRYVFWLTSASADDLAEEENYGEVGPTRVLYHIGKIIDELGLLSTLEEGTELFRARTYSKPPASPWNAGDLGTPPLDRSKQGNRMSPAGIPMFYGAESLDVTMAEVSVRTEDRKASAGRFLTSRPSRVVDLTKLPRIPSIFDAELRHNRSELEFLHRFTKEISAPIEPGRDQIDYVPTQVMTEYLLRVHWGHKGVSGIRYPSAASSGEGCVVMDVSNENCLDPGDELTPDQLQLVLESQQLFKGTLAWSHA